MGCCCAAHLLTKVTEYLRQSKDNRVEVSKLLPLDELPPGTVKSKCDYCSADAEYMVSYFG
jgi:hypothetical protein